MDFKQLESFVTLAKLKSFSKTAEKLYLTQPTVSNHISNIEKELDTLLVNRSNKKVTLTPAGELLLNHALAILNERDQTLFDLDQFKGEIIGTLEIASSSIPERYLLSNILCSFSKLYPKVKYNMLRFDSKQVIDKLLSGEIDFGIVGSKIDKAQLIYKEIFDDEVILIAPPTKEYLSLDIVSTDFFIDQRLIFREEGSGTRKTVEEHLSNIELNVDELNIVAYMENTETIKEVVKNGMGLSFVSKHAVVDDLKNGLLIELPIKNISMTRSFYFVYHKKMLLSPLSEKFKDYVMKEQSLAKG